jgi:hypothetical protein
MTQIQVPSERRILPAEMIHVPAGAAKNINAVADGRSNGVADSLLLIFLIQSSIQLERRADEGHVGKSLWKIAQMLAGGAELLRV